MSESQAATDVLPNVHRGEGLKEEFFFPLNISAYRLEKEINVLEWNPAYPKSSAVKGALPQTPRFASQSFLERERSFG